MRESKVPIIILSFIALIALGPFVWVFAGSLKNTTEIFMGGLLPRTWRWVNYAEAWKRAELAGKFINSVFVSASVTFLTAVISSLAGYSFAKMALRRHAFLFYVYFIGLAIPSQATVLAIALQLRSFGLQDSRLGLVLALAGTGTAFATYLMRSFFRDIPDSYGESAMIDGASESVVFARVYLPLAKPGLLALIVFAAISTWNEFLVSLVVLIDDALWTIPLAVASFRTPDLNNLGLAFASAVISFVPTLVVFLIFQRSFIDGISVGGVKE